MNIEMLDKVIELVNNHEINLNDDTIYIKGGNILDIDSKKPV